MKKTVSKVIAKIAFNSAKSAASKASDWGMFQTNEPKNLNKMLSK